MLPKKFKANQTRTIVVASITLVIGVLFCCSLNFGDGLSWLIGGSLCFAGALYIINSMVKYRSLFTAEAIIGVGAVSFGIMFMIEKLAHILLAYVPYLMIAIGIAVIIEAFLSKFARYNSIVEFIITLIVGMGITALGFCLMFIPGWTNIAAVVFGCILIAISLYTLISLFLSRKEN
ncbi:MAG: hypothetical protein IJ437_01035 [Clostridia bacterium]|nr:hypothetical protein [Clostridia bacterium]